MIPPASTLGHVLEFDTIEVGIIVSFDLNDNLSLSHCDQMGAILCNRFGRSLQCNMLNAWSNLSLIGYIICWTCLHYVLMLKCRVIYFRSICVTTTADEKYHIRQFDCAESNLSTVFQSYENTDRMWTCCVVTVSFSLVVSLVRTFIMLEKVHTKLSNNVTTFQHMIQAPSCELSCCFIKSLMRGDLYGQHLNYDIHQGLI